MPAYEFVGDTTRVYPSRPLTANPGDVAEWETPPDGWWRETGRPVTRTSDNLPQPEPPNLAEGLRDVAFAGARGAGALETTPDAHSLP